MTSSEPMKAVLCLGGHNRGPAEIIAGKRGWPIIQVETLTAAAHEIVERNLSATIVVAGCSCGSIRELLDFSEGLARQQSTSAVSLIIGSTQNAVEELACRIPGIPAREPPSLPITALAHQDFKHIVLKLPLDTILPTGSDAPNQLGLLSSRSSLIYLLGHSNGQDAGFEGLVLCQHHSSNRAAAAPNTFPCYSGAACRFRNSEYKRISPDVFVTRKIVNLTCWGVSVHDHPFSRILSVGDGLLRNKYLQTLLTTIRPAQITDADLLLFYFRIAEGLPFGEVAARVNAFRMRRGFRGDYFCIGDPEGSISPMIKVGYFRSHGDGVGVARCETDGKRTDFVVAIPRELDDRYQVVLLEAQPEEVEFGISDGSDLFLSMCADATRHEFRLRLLSCQDTELAILTSVRELSSALEHVEWLASLAADDGRGEIEREAQDLCANVAAFKGFAKKWPYYDIKPGDVLLSSTVELAFSQLTLHLSSVAVSLLQLYNVTLARGGTYFMRHADGFKFLEIERIETQNCAYCGDLVEDVLVGDQSGHERRVTGCCYTCGPVYDVPSEAGGWLLAMPQTRSGEAATFHMKVGHPYMFPVKAFGLVAIPKFGAVGVGLDLVGFKTIEVAPGEHATLEVSIDIPAGFIRGIYYVIACLAVGTLVHFFRRPLLIEGSEFPQVVVDEGLANDHTGVGIV
jgi:hypothetical protein